MAKATKLAKLMLETDMTIYHAADVKQQLIDAVRANKAVQLDLSRVGEMDTAGFQLLVLAKRESQRLNRELSIVSHSEAVHQVIDFYNMSSFFGDPVIIPADHH